MKLPALAALSGLLLAGSPLPAAEPPPDERTAAYREFRGAFDARRYADALPHALEVVRLSEQQFGREARQLANPLANLATVHYRLGDFGAALDQYTRALSVLESGGGGADPQMIRPLEGIAAAYRGLKRHDESVAPLRRAIDISRNREGLFNTAQLALMRPLVDTYMLLGRVEEAGKEQQYAYTIAENAYGREDPRVLKALDDYARWNEAVGRYTAARLLHGRAVQIAEKAGGRGSPLAVDGLRGIARAYRLGYVYGEDEEQAAAAAQQAMADTLPSLTARPGGPNPDGERALRAALQALGTQETPDAARLGEVLVDLGDWWFTLEAAPRAMASYRDAWKQLDKAGATRVMDTPVLLAWRPTMNSTRRRQEDPETHERRTITMKLTVGADGLVRDVVAGGDNAAGDGPERAVVAAMKRARYRPRFVAGEPVATPDVSHVEEVWVRRREPAGDR